MACSPPGSPRASLASSPRARNSGWTTTPRSTAPWPGATRPASGPSQGELGYLGGDKQPGRHVMADDLAERLRAICLALPEVTERPSHGAPAFFVRDKKSFLQLWASGHHDDDFPHL